MYSIGIDVGSTYAKYCILDEQSKILNLWSEQTPVRQKAYFADKLQEMGKQYPGSKIVSCGYGRKNIGGQRTVSELTALAVGVNRECPQYRTVLDIGGQDTKIIEQENGKLRQFFLNDKCAAGCGMFLKNTLDMLKLDFHQVSLPDETLGVPALRLSNICAVFAQSEIVEAIAQDLPPEVIIQAVVYQILNQAKRLVQKTADGPIVLSGGLTHIQGIGRLAEQILGCPVSIPKYAPYLSAIGCAVLGEKLE